MNERIKELHNEAEKWVADNFSTDELDPYEWWEKSEQKFAELIVRECANIAREWSDDYVVEDTAPKQVDMFIKQHFGVAN